MTNSAKNIVKTKLTTKQQNFIKYYLANGGNGTQSARDSGYKGSETTLAQVAAENLRKPHIKSEIEKAQESLKQELEITAEWKRSILKSVIERSMQAELVLDHSGEPTGEYKFNASDVVRAIAELNKMDGDYADKKQPQDRVIKMYFDADDEKLL